VTDPGVAGAADHVCWVYDDTDSFADVASRFLAAGLARGERLLCVAEEDALDRLRRAAGPLGPVDDLVSGGSLTLVPLASAYSGDTGFVPERQHAFYDAATRRAVADGHTGLRVVAELTPLAADPARSGELVRWEHLADDFMATGSGMSALCAYQRGALGCTVLTEVATVHPQLHVAGGPSADDLTPFRVFADDGRVVVAGSVDAFAADRLRRVLACTPVDRDGGTTLDLTALAFADAAGCRAVAGWADDRVRAGRPVAVVGASPLFARVWRLLGYDRIVPVRVRGRAA
jgi:anti-anti-sigma regulatory factor